MFYKFSKPIFYFFLFGFTQLCFAQRPFQLHDPLYRGETALRTFFEKYAFSTEVLYQASPTLPANIFSTSFNNKFNPEDTAFSSDRSLVGSFFETPKNMSLNFRIDYKYNDKIDLFAIIGNQNQRSEDLSLNWAGIKLYRNTEEFSYALRFAANPFSDVYGFPQIDMAFLTNTNLSRKVSSDFALGWRKVQYGVAQNTQPENELAPTVPVYLSRANGQEVHISRTYNVKFDPASSYFYAGALVEAGSYSLLKTLKWESDFQSADETTKEAYQGGVIWLRTGINLNRPNFQFSPYFNYPMIRFGDGYSQLQLGASLTLR